jgi:hypothetical protein
LSKAQLEKIDAGVKLIEFPRRMGRFPTKITSGKGFSNMVGDEWRNWTLYCSDYCLVRAELPKRIVLVWAKFVEACHLLCPTTVLPSDLDRGHDLLLQFSQDFSSLFDDPKTPGSNSLAPGAAANVQDDGDGSHVLEEKAPAAQLQGEHLCCESSQSAADSGPKRKYDEGWKIATPNMHRHIHLADVLRRFGTAPAIWGYGFERAHGVLRDVNTNNRTMESHFMNGARNLAILDTEIKKLGHRLVGSGNNKSTTFSFSTWTKLREPMSAWCYTRGNASRPADGCAPLADDAFPKSGAILHDDDGRSAVIYSSSETPLLQLLG